MSCLRLSIPACVSYFVLAFSPNYPIRKFVNSGFAFGSRAMFGLPGLYLARGGCGELKNMSPEFRPSSSLVSKKQHVKFFPGKRNIISLYITFCPIPEN